MCATLLFGALGVFVFKKSEAVRAFVRPFIADNIILIQNIRKLSDVVFLPQILLGKDTLPHLELKLSGRDIEKLNGALPRGDYTEIEAAGLVFNALEGSAKKRVNAKLVYEGREYDVRVGFRGTTYDHWYYPKKSWHISFQGESPFGFTEADLIIPRDRDYLGEELNHFRSRKLGLFVPESEFVSLSINGGGKMIYWLVEDWSAEMPAAHGRRGCLFGANLIPEDAHRAPFYRLDAWSENTNCGAEGKEKLAALLAILKLPKEEFQRAAERLLDIEKVLRWEAAARLAGSGHAYGYNMRVFWDATTQKFEFIPWDFGLEVLGDGPLDSYYNDFVTRLFEHEKYVAWRNAILAEYISAAGNVDGDLAYYNDLAAKTEAAFYKDRLKTASILAVNKEIAKGRTALVGNVEYIKAVLGISGTGGPAAAGASAAPRIEYEEILAVPYEKRKEVWAYLKERFGEGEGKLSARVDTEEFTDVYFDTRALALLGQEAVVRYRTRSRTDKEPLVQVKTGGNAISRGEWKFAVKADTPATAGPLVGRIVNKEQKEFTDKIASLDVSAGSLQPILELAQERHRIYFSENGEDILAISLDIASTKRWWAEAAFASVDIEISEVAYTAANEPRRAELRRAAAALVADITAQFPDITPDREPKYVKAFAGLAEKIPFYRFLVGVGVL